MTSMASCWQGLRCLQDRVPPKMGACGPGYSTTRAKLVPGRRRRCWPEFPIGKAYANFSFNLAHMRRAQAISRNAYAIKAFDSISISIPSPDRVPDREQPHMVPSLLT